MSPVDRGKPLREESSPLAAASEEFYRSLETVYAGYYFETAVAGGDLNLPEVARNLAFLNRGDEDKQMLAGFVCRA